MTIDVLLRGLSVLIFLFFLHQIFLSKGGTKRHNIFGHFTILTGVLLAIVVTIRGMDHSTSSLLYVLHLATGIPFFVGIFMTGALGFLSHKYKNAYVAKWHQKMAYATSVFLLLTLIMGISSKFIG